MALAQGVSTSIVYLSFFHPISNSNMAPMKAMKVGAKAMTKGAIAEALAAGCELKKSVCAKALDVLAEVATQGVKKSGVFAIPGLCRLRSATSQPPRLGRGKSSERLSW